MDICSRIDQCDKVAIVLDKDLSFDWVYAEVVRQVCAKCEVGEGIITVALKKQLNKKGV